MTQTNIAYAPTETYIEVKTGERELPLSEHVRNLVNHVARSSEYRTLRSKGSPHTEAYSGAIEAILEDKNNGFSEKDSALLDITAKLGSYVEAQAEMNRLKAKKEQNNGYLDYADYQKTVDLKKRYLIPFNHSIKSLANEAPNLNMRALTGSLGQVYAGVFANYNSLHPRSTKKPQDIIKPSEAMYEIETSINGMRHELAAETMLDTMNIEYDYSISVEEDAKGIDIIVYYRGERIPVDLKASSTSETNARIKHPTATIAWTTLGHEDFMGIHGNQPGSLSVPFDTAKKHAPAFIERILY